MEGADFNGWHPLDADGISAQNDTWTIQWSLSSKRQTGHYWIGIK